MAFSSTLCLVALCLLPLVSCESVWNDDKFQSLKQEWDECKFPPNVTRADDILGICKQDENLHGLEVVCSLFEEFVKAVCSTAIAEDINEFDKQITNFVKIDGRSYKLCGSGTGFQISETVMKLMDEETCTRACSGQAAEKLCHIIVIFSMTGYRFMETAANKIAEKKKKLELTSVTPGDHQQGPNTTLSSVTTTENNHTSDEVNGNTTTVKTTTVKTTTVKTTTAKPKDKQDKQEAPTGSITYGKLSIYGVSFLLLCVIIFAGYKYRHSILYCLRDNQGGGVGPSANDGKGGYKKIPNFERFLPNTEEREKAKSFIY